MLTVLQHQHVFEPEELYHECHASSICVTDLGTPVCAWFGGGKEKADDVAIWASRWDKETNQWEPQRMIANSPEGDEEPCWNPVLFQIGERTMLFFKAGKEIPQWRTYICESVDDGRTWSRPHLLVPMSDEEIQNGWGARGPVKNKPIWLVDGAILAPSSIEKETTWDCFADRSEDNGKTWNRSPLVPMVHEGLQGKGIIQPSLWQDEERDVHMMMRSSEGFIYHAVSKDGGKSWGQAEKTLLPNNNSGLDLVRIPEGPCTGDLYLVCNPVGVNWGARTPIVLMRSTDNGATWEEEMQLDHIPCSVNDRDAEFSYPAIVCETWKEEGEIRSRLHITYTWRRRCIEYWQLLIQMNEKVRKL